MKDGKVPMRAVIGGVDTSGEKIYVGRVKKDGTLFFLVKLFLLITVATWPKTEQNSVRQNTRYLFLFLPHVEK